jgi:hypothetical protein
MNQMKLTSAKLATFTSEFLDKVALAHSVFNHNEILKNINVSIDRDIHTFKYVLINEHGEPFVEFNDEETAQRAFENHCTEVELIAMELWKREQNYAYMECRSNQKLYADNYRGF